MDDSHEGTLHSRLNPGGSRTLSRFDDVGADVRLRARLAMKRAFVGVIHGGESDDRSESGGETVVYSGDESSTGETELLYQLQDGRIGGCADGDSIPDPFDPPNRVAIFMAGTQPALHSSTAAAMISGSTAATAVGAGGPVRPPAQVLSDFFDALATLMPEVNPARSVNRALSRTSAPTSLRRLSVRDLPGLSLS